MIARPVRSVLALALLVACTLVSAPQGAGAGPLQPKPEAGWLAGDLHVHTYHSHDVCESPTTRHDGTECGDEFYTWGFSPGEQIANAESRGLDFVGLSDHNTVAHQSDPGFRSSSLILVPSYENSLRGHGQMLGARKIYDKGDSGPAAVNAMIDQLHADGGLFQINHPAAPAWPYGPEVAGFDTIEVWNLNWIAQRDVMGDGTIASNNPASLVFLDSWLDRGKHVAVTGGSDSHWRGTFAVQGVGQPTTWVHSAGRTLRELLAGIRRGRTFISASPPNQAPTLAYLEADANRNGIFETIVGGTVSSTASFRIRVVNGLGRTVRLVTDGSETLAEVRVTSNDFTHAFSAEPGTTWVRAEVFVDDLSAQRTGLCLPATLPLDERPRCLEHRYLMQALTSPIYLA